MNRSDLRKHEIRNHNRVKRDYIGGEPTYKQVERLQRMQEDNDAMEREKWRQQQVVISQPQQATFIDQMKDFIQTTHPMYVSDGTGIIQQPIGMYVLKYYFNLLLKLFTPPPLSFSISLFFFFFCIEIQNNIPTTD